MNINRGNWFSFVLAVLGFQLLVDATVLLNIPVARQVFGFIYLTFVPGAVVVRLFREKVFGSLENFLFSVGLSIAFVLFVGAAINQFGLLFQLAVLSAPTLLYVMNFVVFSLCFLSYFFVKDQQKNHNQLKFSLSWILAVSVPFLAILGTMLVNSTGNSMILLLMIAVIAFIVIISSVKTKTNWALTLFLITAAILLQSSLISNYIIGYDVHPAYHVFKITQDNKIWNSAINESDILIPRTNQMLSVTVFPTIYSSILNLEGTWIFKIVYPLIFALVPLGLFKLYQKYVEKKVAFVAAFLILASITFVAEMPGLPTQMIGEFFLVLSLIVLFSKDISRTKKLILFSVFSMGMIVSHYGLSYIFMFLIFFAWIVLFLRKKQTKIKITFVILFFVLAFFWYIYTAQSASFNSLLDMGENIYTSFWTDFFNPQSRAETALTGVALGEPAVSIGHWVGRIFHYATQFFIIFGVASVFLKKKTIYRFDGEYTVISLIMLVFALSPLVTPSFNLFNVTRAYHISLLFLAPFCVIGGELFFSTVSKKLVPKLRKSYLPFFLVSLVITSLFLFETGFIYEVTKDVSYSVPLSRYRMNRGTVYGYEYLSESADVFGAVWLRSNIVFTENTTIYGDLVSTIKSPLTSYAAFPLDQMRVLNNVTSFEGIHDYVYLRRFNTFDGKFLGDVQLMWNQSDISPLIEGLDKIYTNGGSEIFLSPTKPAP